MWMHLPDPGPVNACSDHFRIIVHGRSSHAATPELGIDALYIASQIVVSLQTVVARSTSPLDTVVVGGKLESGTAYNIVAEKATLDGTVRAFDPASREHTAERIRGDSTGDRCHVRSRDRVYI